MIEILSGDAFASHPSADAEWYWRALGVGIAIGSQAPGEAPTLATHVGGFPESGPLHRVKITEATFPRWHTINAADALAGKEASIWRPVALTYEQRVMLGDGYKSHEREPYNLPRIAGMGIDAWLSWKWGRDVRFLRSIPFLKFNVCSTGIAQEVGKAFDTPTPFKGVPVKSTEPDDIMDHWQKGLAPYWVKVLPLGPRMFAPYRELVAEAELERALAPDERRDLAKRKGRRFGD